MLDTSLTLITPTAGRPSLERTLRSALPQMRDDDEYLIMGDTRDSDLGLTQEIVAKFDSRFKYIPTKYEDHSYGHNEINRGLELASKAWISGNDDDDIYAPQALDIIRATISSLDEPRPLLFRFKSYVGVVFWDIEGNFRENHVGGHCGVMPNLPGRVGRYTPRYQGDFDYLKSTVDLWPNGIEDVRWVDRVIAIARPSS